MPQRAARTVSRIDRFDPSCLYETALVLTPCDHLSTAVSDARRQLSTAGLSGEVLAPHLTLLFLGRWPGAMLERLRRPLIAAIGTCWSGDAEGFGRFIANSQVVNLHIRIVGDASLLGAHVRAVAESRSRGCRAATPHVLGAYSPHVSIFDRMDVAPEAVDAAMAELVSVRGHYRFDDPHFIGINLGPRTGRSTAGRVRKKNRAG